MESRKLVISAGGKWYLVFTIALGVVAILSGNNVIYLLESLLLSGMIYSGILSEYVISKIRVQRSLRNAKAGIETSDLLLVENTGFFPAVCVEVGEWNKGQFLPLAFLPFIGRKAKVQIRSQQVLPKRGMHQWEAIAIATSFPFAFARKIRVIRQAGERLVWPSPLAEELGKKHRERSPKEWDFLEGELIEDGIASGIDGLVWLRSIPGERHLRRRRELVGEKNYIELLPPLSEEKISEAATAFYLNPRLQELRFKKEMIPGRERALQVLSLLPEPEA